MTPFGSTTATATATATTAATVSRAASIDPRDCKVPQVGDDGISSLAWSPTHNYLASSNWDGGVRLWQVEEQATQVRATPQAMVRHDGKAPVLDCCFSADGSTLFSGGGDKAVRMWKLASQPPNWIGQQIGVHDSPVKAVRYLPSSKLVVSGGWDRKLKFWDQRSSSPVGYLDLPERVYGLDVRGNLMVAITADRKLFVYDASGPQPVLEYEMDSPLRCQSRCVACLPNQKGFAIGGLEGRVCIRHRNNAKGFRFQCHRQGSDVFAVNAIAFANRYSTFATCGADGGVSFWNKDLKQKVKEFKPIQRSISCATFNTQGNLFAYSSSYDWSKGCGHYAQGSPNEIYVHYTPDSELKPRK
ncbi:unnamed protein product [Cylindrotheca closterium]|uniref:mRNA export factor n=1 Tax=Cylindrotheca closterium TaxID=2856 RepID=A0AAD2FRB6_9STRA|nr:unnamed protein product [Cylindrotheca closterium]